MAGHSYLPLRLPRLSEGRVGPIEIKDYVTELSLERGHIYEVIVSTFTEDGRATAAPMGITFVEDQSIVVRPFKTSLTFRNLRARRCGVANITLDPSLFYAAAFKWMDKKGEILLDRFERARRVDAPRITLADGYIEFTVDQVIDESVERGDFICSIRMAEGRTAIVKPYSRSTFATIESVIHATRVPEYLSRGWTERATRLSELIEYYGDLVARVSPNSQYEQILREIVSYVRGTWRKNEGSSAESV